jgi:hypothetical protein
MNELIRNMQRERASGRIAVMPGNWSYGASELFLGNRGKLTAPPGKRLIEVAERSRCVDSLSSALIWVSYLPEPGPVPFFSQELRDVLQPPPQRDALVRRWLPTPFLVTEPFQPLPESLPGMVEQVEDIVT